MKKGVHNSIKKVKCIHKDGSTFCLFFSKIENIKAKNDSTFEFFSAGPVKKGKVSFLQSFFL